MSNLLLSEIAPGGIIMLLPMMALLVPIIIILVKHQQRMAEIIHGQAAQQSNSEFEALRREVYELKQLIHQQTIALDAYSARPSASVDTPLQRRLEEV